jgi:hypothetical protein
MAPTVFYASGTRGKSIRADGHGGILARGWYVRVRKLDSAVHGPFESEVKARRAAFGWAEKLPSRTIV